MELRWRPLAAAEAGAAASGAAGMPVRWPRRPAAVSEAAIADADAEPDLSCAGELEQPRKALIGKVCRPPVGRSVAWSVARSVLVELSISCVGVLCLESSAGAGALGFPVPGYWLLWASRLFCSRLVFCHGRCMCVPVGTAPSSSCASLLVSRSLRLSRLGSRALWNHRWLDEAARCYHARAASARGALCACFGGWGFGAF